MPQLRYLPYFWWLVGGAAAYVVLDILCGPPLRYQPIYPIWHPAAGLAMFILLRGGWRALIPLVLAATLSATLMPVLPSQIGWSIFIAILPLPAYFGISLFMLRYFEEGNFLTSHQTLIVWTSVLTFISLLNGLIYSSVVVGIAAFASDAWFNTLVRYGVAEVSGVVALMAIAFCLGDKESRFNFFSRVRHWETAAYILCIALIIWLALRQPPQESMTYYLLFFPLAWAAARQGLPGAVTATVVLEICVMACTFLPGDYAVRVSDIQMLVLTLTLSGFLIGIAVDAARRASHELRQSLRLAAAGEMAAALAHELNQPLTALAAYGSACVRLIERDGGNPQLQTAVVAMAAESARASNVLKRLRDFFRTGSTQLESLALTELIGVATQAFYVQASAEKINFSVQEMPSVMLLGDRIQLEIVLRNLLANAFQAVAQHAENTSPQVKVNAGVEGETVWIKISDNGPGIANKIRARLFEPFVSLKSSGMGLGLAISRAIIETHGGTLSIEPSAHGILKIILPIENFLDKSNHEPQ